MRSRRRPAQRPLLWQKKGALRYRSSRKESASSNASHAATGRPELVRGDKILHPKSARKHQLGTETKTSKSKTSANKTLDAKQTTRARVNAKTKRNAKTRTAKSSRLAKPKRSVERSFKAVRHAVARVKAIPAVKSLGARIARFSAATTRNWTSYKRERRPGSQKPF